LYRYGGDEFLLLLPETTCEQTEVLLKRLNGICPELTTTLGCVTFSAGIASYVSDASAKDLLKLADERLYQSKRLGKGHITSH